MAENKTLEELIEQDLWFKCDCGKTFYGKYCPPCIAKHVAQAIRDAGWVQLAEQKDTDGKIVHGEADLEALAKMININDGKTWQATDDKTKAAYKLEAWELLDLLSLINFNPHFTPNGVFTIF